MVCYGIRKRIPSQLQCLDVHDYHRVSSYSVWFPCLPFPRVRLIYKPEIYRLPHPYPLLLSTKCEFEARDTAMLRGEKNEFIISPKALAFITSIFLIILESMNFTTLKKYMDTFLKVPKIM